ncbi:excitatory amino acid transporter 2-like isoform X2 [Limulus polyphemus]|uniref:Amino acid transporter n=1 Tax=Limulus polyphemus TaxID=6850 RepID=A0ABM1SD36_LIMPO|nr:excitatory amino acid transporter 2-like isoform X2 [Limulus polyphemus]
MVFQEGKIPPNVPQHQGFKLRPFWRRHKLSILIVTATVTGFSIGLTLRHFEPDSRTIQLIGFPGKIVIRSFILLIVPLIVCNVTVGISSLGKGDNGRLVGLTISFFFGIALFCAVLGIVLAFLIHPGKLSISSEENGGEQYRSNNDDQILDSVIDLFRNAFPNNLMRATFMNEVTVVEKQALSELSTNTTEQNATTSTKVVKLQDGVNYIGLLVFSVVFGCAMASLGDKVVLLRQVIVQVNAVIMKILQFLLWILIIGMFFWMCEEGLKTPSVTEMFQNIGLYLVTVFTGYAIHQLFLLPALYLIIVRKNPLKFFVNILPVFFTAIGTSSSAATLPVTMRTMEEQNKAHPCVTRFVLPLGMIVHMGGGCIDLTIQVLFISQVMAIHLGAGALVILSLTTVLLTVAAPGIAGGPNPVFLLAALSSVGIRNPSYISLLLAIDWLVDRFRTSSNVIGDCYVAMFVQKLCKHLPDVVEDKSATNKPVNDAGGGDDLQDKDVVVTKL